MKISKNERRAIRREWINHYLQLGAKRASEIKLWVRLAELTNFDMELRIYP